MSKCPCIDCLVIPACRQKGWGRVTSDCQLAFDYVTESIFLKANPPLIVKNGSLSHQQIETNEYDKRTKEIKRILRIDERMPV